MFACNSGSLLTMVQQAPPQVLGNSSLNLWQHCEIETVKVYKLSPHSPQSSVCRISGLEMIEVSKNIC